MDYTKIEELRPVVEDLVMEFLKSNDQIISREFWFNLGEASKYIGVSRNTLKKYIVSGEIKMFVLDGVKRISQSQLDQFMKSKGI